MNWLQQACVVSTLWASAMALSGCSTAAVGASAVGAMADAMASNSHAKSSMVRAQLQTDMQAFEDAQLPKYEESKPAYLRVITQMQKEGLWFASLAHIDALESQWKVSAHSRLLRADALRHTGNKDLSAALYRQLLDGQYASSAWHGLGLIAAADGNFDEAVTRFQMAQKKSPTNAQILNDLGFALLHTGRAAQAGLPLKQAAQLDAKNARIQSNLALYLVMFGSTEEALAWMNQSAMSKEQRVKVLERAQAFGEAPIHAEESMNAVKLPQIPKASTRCSGCLIFEKKLPANPAAS